MRASTCNSIPDHQLASVQRKHRGRSLVEGMKVTAAPGLAFALAAVFALVTVPAQAWTIGMAAGLAWITCAVFILFFFRDANPHPSGEAGVILSPAHGTIDYIDIATETIFLNGPARRISIYLSLLNVHVQYAPAAANVGVLQHFPGRWSRAKRRDASLRNEHLLVGFTSGGGNNFALRLISGIWVRRIVPWIARGQRIVGGERIGLIRFGSRVDVFLPLSAQVSVRPGDKVRGGETILARFAGAQDFYNSFTAK